MTELLFALGLGERVVGVTTFCDYPEGAKKLSKIGGMSNPSLEAVVSLRPDLVVLTTDGNSKEFEARLRSFKIKTYVFRARQIQQFPQGIRDLGETVGAPDAAASLAGEIERDIVRLKARSARREKVLFIVWPDPLIVAGHGSIADNAMTILGAVNIAAGSKIAYPKYSIEEIFHNAPDIIFIGRGKGMGDVSGSLLRRLKTVPAVKNGRVFFVGDYLYRLTPRTLKGAEELAFHMDE